MNYSRAQSIVLMSGVTVFFLGWFNSAKSGQVVPPAKFLIGASVTFLALEVLADVQPDLAAAFAIAIGTTAFFHYGPSTLGFLNGTAANQSTKPKTTTQAAKPNPVHVAPHP